MIDNPRIDLLIAKYGRTLVIGLAVAGILALAVSGWAVATPETAERSQVVGSESVTTELGTQATVERDGLWSAGTQLNDEPVYLTNTTSTLTLTPRTSVPTDDADVTHDLTLRYEATRDGAVFWNETERLDRASPPVTDGVARSAVDVDIASIRERRGEIESELAGVGDVRVVVGLETTYDTGTNADALSTETHLVATQRAFWLDEPVPSDSQTHTDRAVVTETKSPSAAFVGLFALLGALSLGAAWRVDQRAPIDETAARRAVHEQRYAEWISRGSIPMWIGEHHISLDTLEDVVDVAIDTSERVVHDRQRGLFAVVTDDVVYYYTDRGLWEETAWPNMDLAEGPSGSGGPESQPPGPGPGIPSGDEDGPDARMDRPSDLDPEDENAWEKL